MRWLEISVNDPKGDYLWPLHTRAKEHDHVIVRFLDSHPNAIQSNLDNSTVVYTTPLILRYIFAQPNFFVQNSSFLRLQHSIMQNLESPFCHGKEVVNGKKKFH